MADNPITRKEKYLAKLTGSYTGNIPDPITRVEKYLYDLCQKGISGLTSEEIENAVNKYLEGKDYVTKTDADKLYQPAGSYLSGTDEDLAVSGKAADAKAVGNAVAKIEGINYTNRGTLADTDAFLINDGTGMKKSVLSKLSDFVLNKIADKVFAKLQTNDKTILGAINELNSNAKYSKYSASLIQSQRIEEGTVKEITLYKFGRLVSVVMNINIKAFHPSATEFVDIFDIPDDYLPMYNLIVNYVTQSGIPMIFQINPSKKKASVYGANELKNDWLIRQVFTYISKA